VGSEREEEEGAKQLALFVGFREYAVPAEGRRGKGIRLGGLW